MPKMKQTAQQQIAQIKQIIRKDANTHGTLLDSKGKMCALGGLAHYGAGISKKRLRTMDSGQAFDAVCGRFPILLGIRCTEIVYLNDGERDLKKRRRKLCTLFDGLLKRKQ